MVGLSSKTSNRCWTRGGKVINRLRRFRSPNQFSAPLRRFTYPFHDERVGRGGKQGGDPGEFRPGPVREVRPWFGRVAVRGLESDHLPLLRHFRGGHEQERSRAAEIKRRRDPLQPGGNSPISFYRYSELLPNSHRERRFLQSPRYVLVEDEWRSFNVSFSEGGQLRFVDVLKNDKFVDYTDKNPLRPLYLFVNSSSALWKVHQSKHVNVVPPEYIYIVHDLISDRFLSSDLPGVSKFGPAINVTASTTCLSFYVTMCPTCGMTFYHMTGDVKHPLLKVYGNSTVSTDFGQIRVS